MQGQRRKEQGEQLQSVADRTLAYAKRMGRLYDALPKDRKSQTIGAPVFRSGTSVGAHYREAVFAKSNADFINKMEGALQELEETRYWLEVLAATNIVKSARLIPLQTETTELIAIFVTIVKRVKQRPRE